MNKTSKIKFLFFGLRARLLILVLLVILPAALILFINFKEERGMALEEARNNLISLARSLADDQQRLVEGSRQLLVTLSQTNAIQEHDADRCNLIFSRLLKHLSQYANVGACDPDGHVFASAVALEQPINTADRPWFQRAVKTKDFAIGDYQIGRIVKKPVIVFCYPVFDTAGVLQSLVFCSLSLEWLNDSLSQLRFQRKEVLLLIDSNGVILARYPDGKKWLGRKMPDHLLVKRMMSQKEGMEEFVGLDGIGRLYAFVNLNNVLKQNIHISVGIPIREAFAKAQRIFVRNLVLLLTLGVVMLIIVFYYSNVFILRPVKTLVSTANRLAEGDLSARAGKPEGPGEIKQLTNVFNQMSGVIQLRDSQLMESETKYRKLHESMMDAFVAVDMRGMIKDFNRSYIDMLGYSETEIKNLNYLDLTPEKWHKFEAKIVKEEVLPKGYSGVYEKEYRKKDGTVFPVELRTFLIRDDAGSPTAMWAIVRDISERKQAEEAIKETQEMYSLFMRHSPIYTYIKYVTPNESRVIQASDNFNRMIGVSGQDMINKTMEELFPAEFAAKITADDWAIVSSGKMIKLEENFKGRVYETIKFPFVLRNKNLIAGYTIDVTERKQAEDKLWENEKKLRSILNSSPVPMALNDEQQNITFLNPAFIKTFGYTIEDIPMLAQWWPKAYPDPQYRQWVADTWQVNLEKAKQSGMDFSPMELSIRCKNGLVKTIFASAAPLGESYRGEHLVILYDITERVQMEQALRVLNLELEEKVKARTAELSLANEGLQKTTKELEAFSFSASHDLHAPLRIIGEFSKILVKEHSDNLNDEAKKILGIISRNTDLMQELIDDLLVLSRMGMQEMKKHKINMTELAQDVFKELKSFFGEKQKADLILKKMSPALGDEKMIRQVFANLFSNAVKFSGKNPEPAIEAGSNREGNEVVYYVKDNGVGFDMQYVDKLFNPFKRLHSQEQFSGSGVGLTIVKRVIERHGGRVWAQGKVNEGAVFYFTLPVAGI